MDKGLYKDLKGLFRKKEPKRQVRSDKKREVKPTLSIKLKKEVERLGFILDVPIKDLGVYLFDEGVHNKDVIEKLSVYFVYDACLHVENTLFYGHDEHEIPTLFEDEPTDRISIRFPQRQYGDVQLLAELMDVTPSRAVAVLLDSAIRHVDIIEKLLESNGKRMELNDEVERQLRKFVKFVNKDNPYKPKWNKVFMELLKGANDGMENLKAIRERRLARNTINEDDYERVAIDEESYKWSFEDEPTKKDDAIDMKNKRIGKRK